MKNFLLVFAFLMLVTSCDKQASKKLAPQEEVATKKAKNNQNVVLSAPSVTLSVTATASSHDCSWALPALDSGMIYKWVFLQRQYFSSGELQVDSLPGGSGSTSGWTGVGQWNWAQTSASVTTCYPFASTLISGRYDYRVAGSYGFAGNNQSSLIFFSNVVSVVVP